MPRWLKVFAVLLCFLIFTIPIEYEYSKLFRHFSKTLIPKGLILPHGFHKQIYFYRADLAALVLLAIALFGLRIPLRQLFFERKSFLLWIVFGLAALSIALSPLAHYSLLYIRLLLLFTPLVLFSLCANGIPAEARVQWTRWILSCLVAAGLLQAGVAIGQYFCQSPLGLSFLGEPQHPIATFHMPNGKRWLFDAASEPAALMRVHGTLTHPNVLGGFLALSLFASYALVMEWQGWRKIALAASLPIQFFSLCLTFSRSALFGWALGMLAWFVWTRRSLCSRLLVWMIVLSPLASGALLSEQMLQRGGIINYNKLSKQSDAGRIAYQNQSLALIKQHPLTGIGFQQYSFTSSDFAIAPHNIYLFLAVETGLLSLAAFLLFFFLLFRAFFQTATTFLTASLAAALLCLLFIGGCDFYPLLFHSGRLMLFITAGLLAGLCLQPRKSNAYAIS